MSTKDFKLPDLGEGLTEGTIAAWHVAVGDVITLNQTVAEIETAKAVVEVPSPFAGTVTERFGEEGEEREVGSVLIRIEIGDGAAATDAPAAAPNTSTGLDADTEPQPLVGYGRKEEGGSRRRRRAGVVEALVGRDEVASLFDGAPAEPALPPLPDKPLAKPPVRKLAKDLGVELASVRGSGDDGIITRDDVRAAASGAGGAAASGASASGASAGQQAAAAPTPVAPVPVPYPVLGAGSAGEKAVPGFRGRTPGEVQPITGIRKRIVEKMETSRREIPEATCSREADLSDLWELRKELTLAAREDGYDVKITPFALVLRATVLALRRFPTLNARIDRDAGEIRLLEAINLGFAADTDAGLVVPNIKDAQSKSLLQIAIELNDLAGKARAGKLTPAEMTGGTFTVSNYGAFGNDTGNPVLNHPEAGILGVGAIRERPWVFEGAVVPRRTATFSLAFDHRISDGGEGGRFVTYVADLCEQPSRILLHS